MPTFFEEVDSSGVVEQHIQQVLKLENSEAEKVLRKYREIRRELADRLAATRSTTFTAQQLRGTLAQVEGAIIAMNESLGREMTPAARRAAERGIKHLEKEIKKFDQRFSGAITPINLDALQVGLDTEGLLINRMESSLDAYGQALRSQIAQGLTDAVILGNISTDDIGQKVNRFFAGEEWKLTRIVRTELHNMYNHGKLAGMGELVEDELPDLQKTLIHPMDTRTGDDSEYVAKLNLIVDIDQPFKYTWKGQERIYMAPPDRPNDRSILVPYRVSWGENRTGFIPPRRK